MTVGEVAGRDSNHLPEQAELELDQSRCRDTGGTGGRRCAHGDGACREGKHKRMNVALTKMLLVLNIRQQ